MADFKRLRKRFVVLACVLAGISVVAVAYQMFPVGASNAELSANLLQTDKQLAIKENQVRPLRGLPEKLVKTNEDILKFYRERLPARQSDISEQLGKLAAAEGVALSDVKYDNFDTDISSLREVIVEATLTGDYAKIARFINAAERAKSFLIVDGITLGEEKGGAVRLQIRFETYLRPASVETASAEKPGDVKSAAPDNKSGKTTAATIPSPKTSPKKAGK